jgi:molybdopterin synthase sulfur carrier subunit
MRVLFFAQLKDATGCDSVDLAPSSPLTGAQLWTLLVEKFPKLSAHRSQVRLSRNWEYGAADTLYFRGDEVALIPPVSGG